MKKVYVAGKLNDDAVGYIKNMHRMIKHANEIKELGYCVYVPCLDFLMGIIMGDYEYGDYFDNSQEWLKVSDLVYVIPGSSQSNGTQREIVLAESLGIPVVRDIRCLYYETNKN